MLQVEAQEDDWWDDLSKANLKAHQTTINNGWSNSDFICINAIAAGTGLSERTGRKARVCKIEFDLYMHATALDMNLLRGLIVYDTQCNGADIDLTQLLQPQLSTGVFAPSGLDRYIILVDKTWAVDSSNRSAAKWRERLQVDLDTIYNSAAATVAAISTGSLWMVLYKEGVATPTNWLCNGTVQTWFSDY